MRKEIENRQDIEKLVETFYPRVKQDDVIGYNFNKESNMADTQRRDPGQHVHRHHGARPLVHPPHRPDAPPRRGLPRRGDVQTHSIGQKRTLDRRPFLPLEEPISWNCR